MTYTSTGGASPNDPVNLDLLHQMLRGELPTGFEHLSDKELILASEGPPEDGESDSPEHALGLLREMCGRKTIIDAVRSCSSTRAVSPPEGDTP